jgi:hypothetical protein
VLSKLLELLYSEQATLSPDDSGVALRSALEELAGSAPGKQLEARGLAARLRTFRHRVVDGMYLEVDDSKRREGVRWVLRRVGNGTA